MRLGEVFDALPDLAVLEVWDAASEEDFYALTLEVLSGRVRGLVWESEDLDHDLPEGLAFFSSDSAQASLIYRIDDEPMKSLQSFFSPPVMFSGAGPGEEEWITVETERALALADSCFDDALASPALLHLLPSNARRHHVGKRGDAPSFDQDGINHLLVRDASLGRKVLRLKGGDPGILGRITEEIDALSRHGIPWQVSPGVSALQAIGPCGGLFLTQRGVSDRVTLTTARQAGGGLSPLLHFDRATLVVYMGLLSADDIRTQLLGAGYPPDIPVCVAVNLARPGQTFLDATLADFPERLAAARMRPPGLIILGDVAAPPLRRLSPPAPLNGLRVLLSCSDSACRIEWEQQLRRWGAKPQRLYPVMSSEERARLPTPDLLVAGSRADALDLQIQLPQLPAVTRLHALQPDAAVIFETLYGAPVSCGTFEQLKLRLYLERQA
ncbi:MAG: hypothetical protein RL095_2808 [Verrucomicrobiota bacterium]